MLSILVAPIASVILGACGCTPAPVPTSPPQTTSPPIVTVTTPPAAQRTEQQQAVGLVNATRKSFGVPTLKINRQLDAKADAWADHLASVCGLEHSDFTSGLPAGWVDVGENVGYGNSIAHVHESYLGSSGHRLNMLKRTVDQVGAGVATARCSGSTRVFTVLVFVDFG